MPANSLYVQEVIAVLAALLSDSSSNIGHIQMPQHHKALQGVTLVKHRRTLEDLLIKAKVSLERPVVMLYERPPTGNTSDQRPLTQNCHAAAMASFGATPWTSKSKAVLDGRLGPFALLKVSDFVGYDEVSKPSPSSRVEQKGIPVHTGTLDGYMDGMDLKEEDRLICVDLLPNRQAEFARAVQEQQFANSKCVLRYCGILSTEQLDVKSQLNTAVYNWWDESSQAPPKRRPRGDDDNVALPDLQLLAWQDGGAIWPQSLAGKFPSGTDEESELTKLRKSFESEFPRPRAPTRSMSSLSVGTDTGARVAGSCDYSQDGEPLDVQRVLDLEAVAVADFSETPLGTTVPKAGKLAVMITEKYEMWVGNLTDSELQTGPCELCGFGTGSYKEMIVINVAEEPSGVAFRITDDRELVVVDKKLVPLCEVLRQAAVDNGLAHVDIESHLIAAKLAPPEGDNEPQPVVFRYNISGLVSSKTSVFKPTPLDGDTDKSSVKGAVLGAAYNGNYNQVINNKRAKICWEAACYDPVMISSNPPRLMPIKPKIYLTAVITEPEQPKKRPSALKPTSFKPSSKKKPSASSSKKPKVAESEAETENPLEPEELSEDLGSPEEGPEEEGESEEIPVPAKKPSVKKIPKEKKKPTVKPKGSKKEKSTESKPEGSPTEEKQEGSPKEEKSSASKPKGSPKEEKSSESKPKGSPKKEKSSESKPKESKKPPSKATKVGGVFYDKEESRKVAVEAVAALRKGDSLESVKQMVDSMMKALLRKKLPPAERDDPPPEPEEGEGEEEGDADGEGDDAVVES
ncbi:cofG [Symbiodinium sp. CCMP2592]|nr:cofG [Symbiodinium sp. CCMP2592]